MNRRAFLGTAATVAPVAAIAAKAVAASQPRPVRDSIGHVVPWDRRYAAANKLLGLKSSTIHVPEEHPLCPGRYCCEVVITGVGTPTRGPHGPRFGLARITAFYDTPKFAR